MLLSGDILVGAAVGSIPTFSMLLTSLFTFNVVLTPLFESSAQYYCAGLILGAVAKELFPLINTDSNWDELTGITTGFFFGLFFINFLDYFVSFVENCLTNRQAERECIEESRKLGGDSISYQSVDDNDDIELRRKDSDDSPVIMLASQAIALPDHRLRVKSKICELIQLIRNMEELSKHLFASNSKRYKKPSFQRNPTPTVALNGSFEEETYADQLDEDIHRLQYCVDHCRRLIQGSGTDIKSDLPRLLITARGREALQNELHELVQDAEHINEYIQQDATPNTETLIEIHKTLSSMDARIAQLHETVEEYSFKWGRGSAAKNIPIPTTGSTIPFSLMIPVTVDCIIDGFLVGSTCAISMRAGIILGLANCIEMGFLGIAVSLRIQKCTASSIYARYATLILPPLVMWLFAGVGAYVGDIAKDYSVVYVGFISFGIVALLYLVVNELLVEARESLEGHETWWTGMILFLGIYSVLLLDLLI